MTQLSLIMLSTNKGSMVQAQLCSEWSEIRGGEWVDCFLLFPLVLGKMELSQAKLGLFCVVKIIYFIKKTFFSFHIF